MKNFNRTANIPPPVTDIRVTKIHGNTIIEWSTPRWSHRNDEDLKPWFLVFQSSDLKADDKLVSWILNVVSDIWDDVFIPLLMGFHVALFMRKQF